MHRALSAVSQKVDLKQFSPQGSTDPAVAIIQSQYGEVRLRLFHSKLSSSSAPNEGLEEAAVEEAYGTLVRLCREILNQFMDIRGSQGSYSNRVLQAAMNPIFKDTAAVFTSDSTPFVEGQPFSPTERPVFEFANQQYTPSATSNTAEFCAWSHVVDDMLADRIYKLGILRDGNVLIVDTIEEGLDLENIAHLEWRVRLLMAQGSMPKTAFQMR